MKLKLAAYIASEDWRKKYDDKIFTAGIFDLEETLRKKYDEVVPPMYSSEGIFKVRLNDKWGFVNTEGKEVVEPKYDEVYDFSDGFTKVEIWNKDRFLTGLVNEKGVEVVKPKYDEVYDLDFHEGLFAVTISEVRIGDGLNRIKWGFINKEGKEVVPPKYNSWDEAYRAI